MYKPINGWTKQRILGHIKREFKGKSETSDGESCLYRGPNGTKCAVGMFIPDELYDPRMDELSFIDHVVKFFPKIKSVLPLDLKALCKLQDIHDQSTKRKCLLNIIQWINENIKG